jgi:predicted DCC family thiol-disulfide oxidoreductase YuxK
MTQAPDPAGAGAILLFDEVCLLCNRFVQFVLRHEEATYFRFASLQSETGRSFLRRFELAEDALDSFYVIDGSTIYARSEAALYVLRRLVAPWRFLAAFKVLPRPFRDSLYRLVAANRYALFGKTTVCALPTDRTLDRIIE